MPNGYAPGIVASLLLLGCVQPDLVAVERGAMSCDGDTCTCLPQTCTPVATTCEQAGFLVLSGDSCGGAAESRAHRYAMCSCSDYTANGSLRVDAFRGTPERAVGAAGDVGVNGDFNAGARVEIAGVLRLSGAVTSDVSHPLETGQGVEETTSPPCDCGDDRPLPFEQLISDARTANDNTLIALDARALDGVQGAQTLVLPCGRYFLTRVAASGALRVSVTGHVSLFIESNIELDSDFEVTVSPGAQLELFVGGTMRVTGTVSLGDVARGQDSLRLHIAGTGSLNLQGPSTIAGVVDAPRAELVTGDELSVYGALLVQRAAPGANLVVHYDEGLGEGETCGEPETGS